MDKGKEELIDDTASTVETVETEMRIKREFIKNLEILVDFIKTIPSHEKDKGLLNAEKAIMSAHEKTGNIKTQLIDGLKTGCINFYDECRDDILTGELGFLNEENVKVMIKFGTRGTANIQISDAYKNCINECPDCLTEMEAKLFFLFENICPEEDMEIISGVCDEFAPAKASSSDFTNKLVAFTGDLIGKASSSFADTNPEDIMDENGKFSFAKLGGKLTDMFNGTDINDLIAGANVSDFDFKAVGEKLMGVVGKSMGTQ